MSVALNLTVQLYKVRPCAMHISMNKISAWSLFGILINLPLGDTVCEKEYFTRSVFSQHAVAHIFHPRKSCPICGWKGVYVYLLLVNMYIIQYGSTV